MDSTYTLLLYLLYCSVNGITPESQRIADVDLEKLYRIAKFHSVRAAICIALERASVKHEKFHEAMKKAIRKIIHFDIERHSILDEFERQGIWYLPLKGIILKDLYPEIGMREMSDNDILYDCSKQKQVEEIMLAKGYTTESIGDNHHDIYHKPPVLNFELHTSLFESYQSKAIYDFYSSPERLLKKDTDNEYGYHFNDEDFYIYMTAHEYKHYFLVGTGIRSLLDCYVYVKAKGDSLDWDYITTQTDQLGISDFEQQRRRLAMKVFSSGDSNSLDENEREMLLFYLTSGTYGTLESSVNKKLKEQSKARYILDNMFPSIEYMKQSVGFVKKCPVLYPVGIVYRWGRILVKCRSKLAWIIHTMRKS